MLFKSGRVQITKIGILNPEMLMSKKKQFIEEFNKDKVLKIGVLYPRENQI